MTTHDNCDALTAEMERLMVERPYLADLLRAFAPLFLAKARWLGRPGRRWPTCPIDGIQFGQGKPLVAQFGLVTPAHDDVVDAAASVAQAMAQGFPKHSAAMLQLSEKLAARDPLLAALFVYPAAVPVPELTDLSALLGIEPVALRLLQRCTLELLLSARARDAAQEIAPLSWDKGYCPVCGSFPHLALLRGQGARWLQCPLCSHEWRYPRLRCPYCEHEDPENSGLVFDAAQKEDAAFVCDVCRRYLLTVNCADRLRSPWPAVLSLSLVPLDAALQQQGFSPMVETGWNRLETTVDATSRQGE